MSRKNNLIHPALKHGGYSATSLLPGEDPVAFEKLRNDVIAEYRPAGRHEEDIVASIARHLWRKQNLSTYRLAKEARDRYSAIRSELVPPLETSDMFGLPGFDMHKPRDPEKVRAGEQAAKERARKELGPTWELVQLGDKATIDHLFAELSVEDRLDSLIDRCLKRLLFVRGLKSISTSTTTATSPPRKRLTAA